VADVAVNIESKKFVASPLADDMGKLNIVPPIKITIKNPRANTCTSLNLVFFKILRLSIK